ncbi:MAG TPA: hypothetical protein PKC13_24490 [Blastocatellia bacterium]|nr:hypothetical protein [Blastocatellia bacterium]HMV87474.1 hypothetical protein [Blastocatellia bacterium]HMX28768.1 hypothetical protein [Blastocatellia bacterium]HMY73909.1 hypothetical protein [Blastocatellia bacterium]HNG33358.1 hypothetical protein [Blastocatellia bacterium]
MTGQSDKNTETKEGVAADQERHERASAPTLRDLRKAARELAPAGALPPSTDNNDGRRRTNV